MLKYEEKYVALGKKLIAGIDEAGRGPLAGPVSVACVIMPLDDRIEGIDDSKKLTEKKREFLYDLIMEKAIAVKCVLLDRNVIDDINILEATKKGMIESVKGLKVKPDIVLIDAVKLDLDIESESIIKGDTLSYNIAAASIIAKVTRDRLMKKYALEFPNYGFEKHKGYGTKMHREAILEYGVTPIHRRSFLKKLLNEKKQSS